MDDPKNLEPSNIKKEVPKQLTPFSKDYQATSEAKKIGWQKRRELKDSANFFLNLPTRILTIEGNDFTINAQDEIAKKLIELAQKGNLKAVELLTKIMPNWLATQKTENINIDIPFKVATIFEDYRENREQLNNDKLE